MDEGCDPSQFLCCGAVFIGGEVWPARGDKKQIFKEIDRDKMLEVEKQWDEAKMQECCKELKIEYEKPKWRLLYCLGQGVY